VHVDVADGIFTEHKSWNNPRLWRERGGGAPRLEIHLMVEDVFGEGVAWLEAGAVRLILPVETLEAAAAMRLKTMADERGAELFVSLNPETPIAAARRFSTYVKGYHVLAVHPGLSGQKFLPLVLEKIKMLRRNYPETVIQVDGGEFVRASASVGGDSVLTPCTGPVAALIAHNKKDTLAPFSGSEKVRDQRVTLNHCAATSAATEPSTLNCVRYSGCDENPVVFCPHTIDRDPYVGYYPHLWPQNMAHDIWQFFTNLP
jgi:pentose-5-phosphate-3-epimerase